jgi:branched-chain amino acid transport system substrate-binding protein
LARSSLFLALIFAAALLAPPQARAAEPYEINTILSLTGNVAFVGSTQQKALKALESFINQHGGIGGRPVAFVFADDQSSAQTAVQLAQGLIAKNVPILLGPSGPTSCAAIAPLVAEKGPVFYCLANGGDPIPGGYEFLTLMSYDSQLAVTVRYFRERGLRRLATIFATDAGGQGAEKALHGVLAKPENKSMQLVAQQHFVTSDASASAQMSRIKGENPDALIAWATGGPAGTLFRSARDIGLDVATVSSPGNLTAAFLKQYAPTLPREIIFPAVPYYGGSAPTDAATKAAVANLTSALAAGGSEPDMIAISAWDPAMLLIESLRELGPDASASKLRDHLVNLQGWVGADGPYDFRAAPQRGIGDNNVIMVRWDVDKGTGVAVSNFGGAPLSRKSE